MQSFFEEYSHLASSLSYWGINLEKCLGDNNSDCCYRWQIKEGISVIQESDPEVFNNQLLVALNSSYKDEVNDYAIWINESIFHMKEYFMKPIYAFSMQNKVDIQIIGSARDYPSYLYSAYQQWGVKHKTYKGPIQGFQQWCNNAKEFLQYHKYFAEWEHAFPGKLTVINFSKSKNIVQSVLQLLPNHIVKNLYPFLSQNKISNTQNNIIRHLIFSILNNRFHEEILPTDSESFINQYPLLSDDTKFIPFSFSKTLPSDLSNESLMAAYTEEITAVNRLLKTSGEPPLSSEYKGNVSLSEEECTQMLINAIFSILYHQSEEIKNLRKKLEEKSKWPFLS